jgi:hypothetical protein
MSQCNRAVVIVFGQMHEQQKIHVTFINNRWVSEFCGYYFGALTLARLIETAQHTFPKEVSVFAVDRKSVEGNAAAQQEVLEGSDSGVSLS